jgi:hypothetical protein
MFRFANKYSKNVQKSEQYLAAILRPYFSRSFYSTNTGKQVLLATTIIIRHNMGFIPVLLGHAVIGAGMLSQTNHFPILLER